MKAFKHLGHTWLLAQFLHPVVFCFLINFTTASMPDIGSLISLFVGSLLISIPAFIISLILINALPILKINLLGNYIIWLVLAISSIVINVGLLILLLGDTRFIMNEWTLFLPSILSAMLSILIRYKQFNDYISSALSSYIKNPTMYELP